MNLYESISVPENIFPMNDTDNYGNLIEVGYGYLDSHGKDGYCRRAEARLKYALSGGRLSSAMHRRLRDDYLTAVGFAYSSLLPLREVYIRRWVELYDTHVWTYDELCHFLDCYGKRDVWSILRNRGFVPGQELTNYLDSRKRRVENDVSRFRASGSHDFSDLQFVEDYVGLLIKDYINNSFVDDNSLCMYIVGLNMY